jgi:hypothetical protein
MDVFNYHPETGEYLSCSPAHPNQLEPGKFLLPAFATFDPPPPPIAGYARVMFAESEWVHVADHRGEVYWLGAERVEISALGPVPAFLSADPPSRWRRALQRIAGVGLALALMLAAPAKNARA